MKINQISFGQTYLKESVLRLSDENKEKIKSLYPLGEIYPVDLYLGSDYKGNLTLDITRTSLYDHLVLNHQLEPTPENVFVYKFVKRCELVGQYLHGNSYPVQKTTISDIDYIDKDALPYYVADEIEKYEKQYCKKLNN